MQLTTAGRRPTTTRLSGTTPARGRSTPSMRSVLRRQLDWRTTKYGWSATLLWTEDLHRTSWRRCCERPRSTTSTGSYIALPPMSYLHCLMCWQPGSEFCFQTHYFAFYFNSFWQQTITLNFIFWSTVLIIKPTEVSDKRLFFCY